MLLLPRVLCLSTATDCGVHFVQKCISYAHALLSQSCACCACCDAQIGSEGHRYGTLCLFDPKPRQFPAEQYALLTHFAEVTTRELERDKVGREWGGGQVQVLW